MRIDNHKLEQAAWHPTPNKGGKLKGPYFIVAHYTASNNVEGPVSWLSNPEAKASAHVVVGYSGEIVQLVPFDTVAWHAGPSFSQGHKNLNSCSIGVEMVNPGPLDRIRANEYRDTYGRTLSLKDSSVVFYGKNHFLRYTPKQLDVFEDLTKSLCTKYPTIFDVVSHQEIDTRGKKRDPGPHFPMSRYTKIMERRGDGDLLYEVSVDKLNVRKGPGTSHVSLGSVRSGDLLEVDSFHGDWARTHKGYVHKGYIKRVK